MDLQQHLKKYAELILKVGLHVLPGDKLIIRLDEHGLPLAREISRQAYALGAHDIYLAFADDQITLARYLLAPEEAFETRPAFFAEFTEAAYLDNYHFLALNAPNPELLRDADPRRISNWNRVLSKANERVARYSMENRIKWCIACLPSPAWAKAVFPALGEDEAVAALWQKIFEATRVTMSDPVAAWQAHEAQLKRRVNFLNGQAFEKLLYRGPGTDLEVCLPEGHVWMGGSSRIPRGDVFMPNIPTEEVFSMPHAYKVNGLLQATMPLSTSGRLIEGMRFVFKDGAVVDFDASSNREILEDLLNTDEGARRLGEVALVGDDSPISRTGLLFKNTLFDENASCHFALGKAYSESHVRGNEMTAEEKRAAGMNDSLIHVDFMVGGPQLEVVGVKADGARVTLLRSGNWVV